MKLVCVPAINDFGFDFDSVGAGGRI